MFIREKGPLPFIIAAPLLSDFGGYASFPEAYLDGVLALPNAYPVLSVYEPGSGWWQVTDHPQGDAVYSETAFYAVSVTAPSDLILAASGSEVDLSANDDGTLTQNLSWTSDQDGPIGQGGSLTRTLSDGTHEVTVHYRWHPFHGCKLGWSRPPRSPALMTFTVRRPAALSSEFRGG